MSTEEIQFLSRQTESPFIAERLRESEQIRARVAVLTRGLSQEQLFWQQPDGGWSIAQVFEHMARLNGSYLEPLRTRIDQAKREPSGRAASGEWRPSWVGRLLIGATEPGKGRSMRTPKLWNPGDVIRQDVVNAFVALQDELDQLVRSAEGVDLNRTKISSPAGRLIRLNLGDAFRVLNLHTERHLNQVERIRARPEFPPA